jgi:glucose/arabinose dehydrogenase
MLPGFRAELVGATSMFTTSIAVDSRDNIYYSLAGGALYRMSPSGRSTLVATLPTTWEGNAGLLGVALIDDATAVVHYTTAGRAYHRVSQIELATGRERILVDLPSDPDVPGREVPTEHHGGNLIIAPDGSIFFGIGDFGGHLPASLPQWIAGKIWRLRPDGKLDQWALGVRNPYDIAWDPQLQAVIVPDNGPVGGDELNVVPSGADCGWPFAYGKQPHFAGDVEPVYVFDDTVAPTGFHRLSGANPLLRRGYLMSAFVTKAIYYFPDMTQRPMPPPVALVDEFIGGVIIDVAESRDGTVYFATGTGIYRLHLPPRGDCNGDDELDSRDLGALSLELLDGSSKPTLDAPNGSYAGSWGCDANADSLIDGADFPALAKLIGGRSRAIRRR